MRIALLIAIALVLPAAAIAVTPTADALYCEWPLQNWQVYVDCSHDGTPIVCLHDGVGVLEECSD